MDVEAADMFAEWLALFLSEKNFRWEPWFNVDQKTGMAYAWTDILANHGGESRHGMFIKELLLRIMRLSYYERVKPPGGKVSPIIPEEMLQWLPAPDPVLPSLDSNIMDRFDQLVSHMQRKMSAGELKALLDEVLPPETI